VKKKLDYKTLPEPLRTRSGCKVAWKYYGTLQEAEEAAVLARHNALIDIRLGYDFGYQSPGMIRKMDDGTFEVCVS